MVRTLTDSSLRVGSISAIADELFRLCNDTSWPILERSRLIIDLVNQRLELQLESDSVALDSTALVCPLKPLVDHLRQALLTGGGGPEQQRLNLPPVPVASGTAVHQKAVTRGHG